MRISMKTAWNGIHSRAGLRPAAYCVAGGLLLVLACLSSLLDSSSPVIAKEQARLELTSSSFRGGKIPRKFTCDGEETSPALAWSAPPADTRSFALFVTDPDAPGGNFVHWILYDVPAEKRALPEGLSKEGQLLDGSRQGRNDFDEIGYRGPCPPGRKVHHYVFTVYALDARLGLPAGQTLAQVESAMKSHILARGELVVPYEP